MCVCVCVSVSVCERVCVCVFVEIVIFFLITLRKKKFLIARQATSHFLLESAWDDPVQLTGH